MDEYRKAMEFVIAKDKTPQYPYGFVEESRDNHGKFPLSGKWNTPKEYAEIAIKEIDARWPTSASCGKPSASNADALKDAKKED